MPTFQTPVCQDALPVGSSEVFQPANQRNNNPVETSNFAFATLLMQHN
jgi:hypothetical protein